MPLAAAQRYNVDTRDDGRRRRNLEAGSAHGAFRRHYARQCSRAGHRLHLARRKTPCAKLHGPGHEKPLPNIPGAPSSTV